MCKGGKLGFSVSFWRTWLKGLGELAATPDKQGWKSIVLLLLIVSVNKLMRDGS